MFTAPPCPKRLPHFSLVFFPWWPHLPLITSLNPEVLVFSLFPLSQIKVHFMTKTFPQILLLLSEIDLMKDVFKTGQNFIL